MTRASYFSGWAMATVLLAGCSGGSHSAAPPAVPAAVTGAPSARQMDALYPHAVSPGSIKVRPMPLTARLPASVMLGFERRGAQSKAVGPLNWTEVPGGASQVAAAPDGSLWAISPTAPGTDGSLWHYVNWTWTNVPGEASAIALGPNGTLYAVDAANGGAVYSYNGSVWTPLGGGALTVTAGADGGIYVLSNGGIINGNSAIFEYLDGVWTQLPGAGASLTGSLDPNTYAVPGVGTVMPNGFFVANAAGAIYYYTPGSGYLAFPGAASGVAAAIGGFFALSNAASPGGSPVYYFDYSKAAWSQQPGSGLTIAAGAATAGTEGQLYVTSAGGAIWTTPLPKVLPPITHVIIVVQENRSTDNLFQGVPGADIATSGLDSQGQTVQLQPQPLNYTYDPDHSHGSFVTEYDGGKMDGFDLIGTGCGHGCPYYPGAYAYVQSSDNAPYVQMAEQYTFGDRMFQTNQGPSYPAHQYILSGTSEPSVGSNLLVAENTAMVGCGPGGGSPVQAIDPSGNEGYFVPSCFEHPTLPDLLDAQGISWRYYAYSLEGGNGEIDIWIAPNSIQHLRNGPDWANVVAPHTAILNDIQSGNLAQVSWVTPGGGDSDHPGENNGTGPSWVGSIVNAVGQSQYWNNTAIFVVWDDWGGWYDHVPPQIFGSNELGFRVPLLVISPYARHGYVSHVQHEFGSIIRFTEEVFNLGSLGFTDARADDLSDCFSLQPQEAKFKAIRTRYSIEYFKHEPPDHKPPDDD